MKLNERENKKKKDQTPCHSSFSGGDHLRSTSGSFAVRDHLRSNLGIISGLGIICGAVQALSNQDAFFVMLIIRNLNLISVQSWTYLSLVPTCISTIIQGLSIDISANFARHERNNSEKTNMVGVDLFSHMSISRILRLNETEVAQTDFLFL